MFLEEKWSKECTIARKSKLVFAEYMVDLGFREELSRGQILRIGNITHPTARTKSANTAITFETVKGLIRGLWCPRIAVAV